MFHKLRNLGKSSSKMLHSAGIHSEGQLRAMGSVAAYLAVKKTGGSPSLNLLWAIEGALTDRDWKEVSRNERTSLLFQLDDNERRENESDNLSGRV
ncbi:TfoX/Sxy family protein [Paludibacterium yongneupense]|uniref:TfoX/Sxy family protein n=1 Tax=Paludibacterium yongneupense TaxID=400061 RepID=UPI000A05D570|nr:TfoX/Sxy family protein [Paludibacterium yongneupense]